uniref:Uncharacterized protein n=1 Tax=Steinernema glaseri TaxID=37863 RepID=A0A1I7ZQX1_9BILA
MDSAPTEINISCTEDHVKIGQRNVEQMETSLRPSPTTDELSEEEPGRFPILCSSSQSKSRGVFALINHFLHFVGLNLNLICYLMIKVSLLQISI